MAKVSVTAICEACGKEFTKTNICRNREEADRWEAWAEQNVTVCPRCYRQSRKEKEDFEYDVVLSADHNGSETSGLRCQLVKGDTYAVKAVLKENGWFFNGMYWCLDTPYNGEEIPIFVTDIMDKVEALPLGKPIIVGRFRTNAEELGRQYQKKLKNAERAEQRKQSKPEWLPEGRWNRKIYGTKVKSIYVDEEKIELSAEQEKELKEYLKLF